MEHSVKGAISYFIVFVFIFAVIWIAKYLILRSKIKRLNGEFKKIDTKRKIKLKCGFMGVGLACFLFFVWGKIYFDCQIARDLVSYM